MSRRADSGRTLRSSHWMVHWNLRYVFCCYCYDFQCAGPENVRFHWRVNGDSSRIGYGTNSESPLETHVHSGSGTVQESLARRPSWSNHRLVLRLPDFNRLVSYLWQSDIRSDGVHGCWRPDG